jgi:hypothetical protein
MFNLQVAINNHKSNVDDISNTHLGWTRANRKFPLFKGSDASSHGQRN